MAGHVRLETWLYVRPDSILTKVLSQLTRKCFCGITTIIQLNLRLKTYLIILYVTKYQLKYELLILHFSTNSPDALELKCIEVWLISCTIFVFLALMEYFVVLFGIRYDKSWSRRRADLRRAASAAQLAPPPLHINHSQVRS